MAKPLLLASFPTRLHPKTGPPNLLKSDTRKRDKNGEENTLSHKVKKNTNKYFYIYLLTSLVIGQPVESVVSKQNVRTINLTTEPKAVSNAVQKEHADGPTTSLSLFSFFNYRSFLSGLDFYLIVCVLYLFSYYYFFFLLRFSQVNR